MKIQILAFEPRIDQKTNLPESFEWQGKVLYPYAVTYKAEDGQQYKGEAFAQSNPPWWEIGNTYDAAPTQDAKRIGGHKLKITRPPMPEHHTGGSPFPTGNHGPQPQFGQGQATAPPQYQQPTPTATQPPPPPPQPQQKQQEVPTRGDFRESLIVAQSSMKAAVEYIPTLSDQEFIALKETLKVQVDVIPAYAKHIAVETYKIAYSLIGKDDLPF